MKNLKGIIIGGPGTSKNNFISGNYVNEDLKKKVIGVKDITYTNTSGLYELFDKSADILKDDEVMTERNNLQTFFETLAKDSHRVVYGFENTKSALEMNAVDKLIIIDIMISDEDLRAFSDLADNSGTELILVTDKTPEGVQFKALTGIGAILRFPIHN